MKKLVFPFVLLLAASVIFTGCRSNDDPTTEYIVVDDNETLDQTVYADEEAGESGVRITTLAPWTSSIREATTTSSMRNAADWVSISPDRGNAGTYTIMITLEPNFLGNDRSAIIAIISGTTTIEIRITQQGETEKGYVPINPEDHSIIRAENIEGDFSDVVTVKAVVWAWSFDGEEDFTVGKAPFTNNGFTLQLTSDIPQSFSRPMERVFPDNFVVSDKNARIFSFGESAITIYTFDSNGDRIGTLWLADMRSEDEGFVGYVASWLYADRDVTIRGTYCGDEYLAFDFDLKRGWNIVYQEIYWNPNTRTEIRNTTQKPINTNLRWDSWF